MMFMNSYCISSKSYTSEIHFAGAVKQLNFYPMSAAASVIISFFVGFFSLSLFENTQTFSVSLLLFRLVSLWFLLWLMLSLHLLLQFHVILLTEGLFCFYNTVGHTFHLLHKYITLLMQSLLVPLKPTFYFISCLYIWLKLGGELLVLTADFPVLYLTLLVKTTEKNMFSNSNHGIQ